MFVNGYTLFMAKVTKELTALDRAIAGALVERINESGLSRRDLRAQTGMSLSRLQTIISFESPPMTVGELQVLAESVGTSAWKIMATVGPEDYALAASEADYDEESEAWQEMP